MLNVSHLSICSSHYLSALPPKECLVMLCHQNASGLTCLDLSITDKWLVIDEAIPPLDYLIIEGGLHAASSASLHFTLNVNYIIISGRLAIGWENEPFNGTARIILRGQHSTPEVPHSGGPELGSKFIGKLTIFSQFFQFGSIFISSFSLVQSLEYKIMKSDFVFVAYQSLLWQYQIYMHTYSYILCLFLPENHEGYVTLLGWIKSHQSKTESFIHCLCDTALCWKWVGKKAGERARWTWLSGRALHLWLEGHGREQ